MSQGWKTIYKALYKTGKVKKNKVKSKKNGRLTESEVIEITGEA